MGVVCRFALSLLPSLHPPDCQGYLLVGCNATSIVSCRAGLNWSWLCNSYFGKSDNDQTELQMAQEEYEVGGRQQI